jgi:hypothetical protein
VSVRLKNYDPPCKEFGKNPHGEQKRKVAGPTLRCSILRIVSEFLSTHEPEASSNPVTQTVSLRVIRYH